MKDPRTGRTQYARRARDAEDIELGIRLAAGVREIASEIADGDEERMLEGAPSELISWYAANGYDAASQWIESRLTDLILNRTL